MEVTAIILAGGKSARLGRNKAIETILGKSLIQHVVDRLRPVAEQILIIISAERPELPSLPGTETLIDVFPGKGPLAGIYTGLLAARHPRSITVACDMPFLNAHLINYLISLSPDFDAVVPSLSQGTVEPLQAVYSKACIDRIRTQLESRHLEIHSFFPTVRVRYVEREECQRFDPDLRSFININNQADLDRAIALAAAA
ncbi:MAG: molybdenum cofactor guanylyltransferase [Chloroflexi bacterium]|nr:molybdenum cofactor guanylyltransferase [Chloroflexota bacterium]